LSGQLQGLIEWRKKKRERRANIKGPRETEPIQPNFSEKPKIMQ
jgi:hypothetical protein